MIRFTIILFGIFTLLSLCKNAEGQTTWPLKISGTDGAVISIYEPQPEKYAGNTISARAAVSVRKKNSDEPVFGVMWFDAILQPDSDNKTLLVKTATISKSKFSDGDEDNQALLKTVVEKEVPGLNIQLNAARLDEMIALEKKDTENGIKTDPPLILYRNRPTTLIVLDGEPIEQEDKDIKLTRVVNSPYLIIKNPDDGKYYLYGGSFWYSSTQVKTGWTNVKTLPSTIKVVDAAIKEQEKKDTTDRNEASASFTTATDIVVSTVPAELIQTEGNPTYKAVEGSTLLYVDNSLDEIFKDIESQKNYILISGRWYSSTHLEGPWQYVPSDDLPSAFASIPKGSEKDGVLASVAGTDAAEEAVMDAHLPQTAKVDRSTATCTVTYDGEPAFVPVQNTNLSLAENSNITVMLAPNNQYYALENGIWFKSANANGPWEVANERPADVEKIPASSPAYNTKYVHVYEATPQYVYVGYTPGYLGSYYYRHTIVWGTGWHYHPWYGHWYYPRPYTWGFGMHYNPWTGWNISFGLSFNYGWFHYHHYHGYGWFGPPMFRPPYRPWGWNGGYYGSHRPGPGRPPHRPNVTANRPPNWNTRPVVAARPAIQNNIYQNRKAVVTRDKVQRPAVRPTNPATRPTNPSARPGVTPRPTKPGARPTQPGTTRPTRPSARPAAPKPSTKPATRPSTRPAVRPTPKPATRPAVKPAQPSNKPPARPPARKRE
ncbi:MAG: hypothetical protein KF746_18645 [Chitinophagaceae bacterium]|nr:hypothetical protein [Chitinophagaceae bacterium]